MGAGAEEGGITIQYCMSLPREVLQSAEIPSVRRLRARQKRLENYFQKRLINFVQTYFQEYKITESQKIISIILYLTSVT